jgi:peptidase M50B-like protein
VDAALAGAAAAWHRATAVQPAPSGAVRALVVLVAAALVLSPRLWPVTRHVVTIVHEGAHGVAALLTGRRLAGIRLHSDTSGLTVSVGRRTGPGMVVTAAAGYLGPALLGLLAAWLLRLGHAVGLLWLLTLLLALLLVQIRSWFGLWSVLLSATVVAGVTWRVPPAGQAAFAGLVTCVLLLAAPRPVLELQAARRRGRAHHSDADQLARLTGLPGTVWVAGFLLGDVAALAVGARWLLAPAG